MSLLAVNVALLLSSSRRADANVWSAFVIALTYPTLGMLIAWRRSENAIGWLFSALGITLAILSTSKAYAFYALRVALVALPGGVAFAWLSGWLFWIILAIIGGVILLFPSGRFLSPRWNFLVWVIIANSLALISFSIFLPGDLYGFPGIPNPLELRGALGKITSIGFAVTLGSLITCLFVATSSLFFRYRLAKPEERQQIKWVVSAFAVNVVLLSVDPLIPPGFWGENIDGLGALLLALALGFAMLRYRLWDIDIVLNRTLVYGALSMCVVGIYVLVVGSLGALFHTGGNLLISLLATSLVAVLFQPLRELLQRSVNRLLYGQRDEPYAVLVGLSQRLGGTLAPNAILPTIVETVAHALKLPYVAILLAREETSELAASFGEPIGEVLSLPLCHQGETIGQLQLAPRTPGEDFTPADRRLLDELVRQAGLAAHAVRLTADLQHSRERIVTAREEERRRLRRDLHDGLGPTLGHLTLQLDAVSDLIVQDPSTALAQVAQLKAQVQDTIADIRQLVYALRPPALDELGLVTALCEQAAQYHHVGGLQVTVEAQTALPPLSAAVEVAAYRIALEALTNVVRHAQARTCCIILRVADALMLDIIDDGRGFPQTLRAGVGLASMRERAAELGGTCVIEARPEGGTRVHARLPLPKE